MLGPLEGGEESLRVEQVEDRGLCVRTGDKVRIDPFRVYGILPPAPPGGKETVDILGQGYDVHASSMLTALIGMYTRQTLVPRPAIDAQLGCHIINRTFLRPAQAPRLQRSAPLGSTSVQSLSLLTGGYSTYGVLEAVQTSVWFRRRKVYEFGCGVCEYRANFVVGDKAQFQCTAPANANEIT